VIIINTQIIDVDFKVSFIGYICSQIITSFLAAGVYLDLVLKIEKSNNKLEENVKFKENS